ncbi:RHS repeat protein [Streptomyces sp. MUM 203J]|uniref:putative T7SS-secreted protein n=1 Tax=Streptomyces sp. MUM 203J TaxID=2791990 RepID=UPI0027E4D952|nr:DUF6531 domain-containing protein [Streptomyces sp. MUM 203J]MCH0538507.1 RHS repeat protein [Streptomyces sp. MUM 203J]
MTDALDGLITGLGNIASGAKRKAGEGIDYVTDKVGGGLERLGADDLADKVEDWGDATASSLGAKVDEQQLGQTEQPDELIHGRPARITDTTKNLRDFESAFDMVGQALKSLDSSHWQGEAGEAFRKKFALLPKDWLHAADAFGDAAAALDTYAKTLTSAQGKAKEAIDLYKEGDQDSKKAVDAYNEKVDAYNAARTTDDPLPKPPPFEDPGDGKRDQAQEILKSARKTRDEAAKKAAESVKAALRHAPDPSATERAFNNILDHGMAQGVEAMHLAGGVAKGTIGITNFLRSMNPVDAYNLTHPAEYYKNINMTLSGLVTTVAHPDQALKSAWEAAKKDPSEFFGRLLPELIGTKGAGGIKTIAKAGAKGAAKRGAESAAKGAARESVDGPRTSRTGDAVNKGNTDPVDMATGAMFLPQTDVTLPGVLPLVFRRRVASDYRVGRWFGPSWSSTVDQRLEIDAEGVVFVAEDGLLLAYPHPAPGIPTLPSHGPRWPLTRDADDGYTITDPDTAQVRHFADVDDTRALLTQIDDRNGNWITFEYGSEGTPQSIVHSGGYHLKLTAQDGRITALHLDGGAPDGQDQEILRYAYTDGRLTEVVNSSGLPLRFAYDDRGRVTSWTDRNGSRYDYAYDDQDRCVAEGGEAGHVALRLTYDETDPETGHRVTTTTTSSGDTRRFLIDEAHQVVAEIDPLGAVTRYERDRRNRLLAHTDPLGRTTRFEYDEEGNLTTAVRPDGRRSTAQHNAQGQPLRAVLPDGRVIRQSYDEKGNRTAVTDPTGTTTHFTYDERGAVTSVTDALGHTTTIHCDTKGLPLTITDPLGGTTRYARDAFGRPTAITDALGATTLLEWTPEGRLSRRTAPDGTTESWTYDGEGNCLTHTNAAGGVTLHEYTHFDLLKARTGPDGVRYEFTHDTELRLTEVLNPQGLTWTYSYDAAGNLTSETDFDDRTLTYEHDRAGTLKSRTNGLGETILYERNELGQIIRKDVAGQVTTYEYDVFDELAVAASPDATLTLLRDRHGRLLSEKVNDRELTYTYDQLGRRTGRTTPTGATSMWTYDAAGNRTELQTSGRRLTFAHDAAGRELSRHIGDTLTLTHAYDAAGRLASQQTATPTTPIQQRSYTYSPEGNLTSIEDRLSGTRRFTLDAAGRVTTVTAANWTERYAYDEAGNQIQASWPESHPGQESTGPRTYTGTRITRAGRIRYEHDAQGRVVLRQKPRLSRKPDTWHYEWDPEDRLTQVATPDGTVWRYAYDPLGRRISKERLSPDKKTTEEQTTFTWDGTTLCEQTTESPNFPHPIALTWDHKGLHPLTQTERLLSKDTPQEAIDTRFFTIITDLVGTPTELVDESGTLAWHTRTTLWGITTWASSSTTYTPLRFPGQYFDPETGLHYNYFRHYDPESARYLSPDPLGLTPAPNPATYVHNPHVWSDPLGLSPYVDEGKLNYLFNKGIKADEHNSARARQNADQLKSIGFDDTPASRQYVRQHLQEAAKNGFTKTFSNQWGNYGETHSVITGRWGMREAEATWQITPDGTLRLTTVIFKGGKWWTNITEEPTKANPQ